jgi:hypothetical protein
MKLDNINEIIALGWSDAVFNGFHWDRNDKDIIVLITPAKIQGEGKLICEWVNDFKIGLDYKDFVGGLITWDATFTNIANARWKIEITIPDHGQFSLECNSFRFEHTLHYAA